MPEELLWTGHESLQTLYGDATKWSNLVLEGLAQHVSVSCDEDNTGTATAGQHHDANTSTSTGTSTSTSTPKRRWGMKRNSQLVSAAVLIFKDVIVLCSKLNASTYKVEATPARINNIVLAPQTVFDLKEEGHPPCTVRFMFGDYSYVIVAPTPEIRNTWKTTISDLLAKKLVEDKSSPCRRPSTEMLFSTTKFERAVAVVPTTIDEENTSVSNNDGDHDDDDDDATMALIEKLLIGDDDSLPSPSPTPTLKTPQTLPGGAGAGDGASGGGAGGSAPCIFFDPATPDTHNTDTLMVPNSSQLGDDQSSSLLRRKAALRKGQARPDGTPLSPGTPRSAIHSTSSSTASIFDEPDSDPMLMSQSGEHQMVLQFVKGELLLMAGTRSKLVEYLTCPQARGVLCQAPRQGKETTILKRKVAPNPMLTKTTDQNFMSVFLLTYRLIMDPLTLLAALQTRFEMPDIENEIEQIDLSSSQQQRTFQQNNHEARIKVLSVIEAWVSDYWHDFALSPELLAALRKFLAVIVNYGYDQFSTFCEELFVTQSHLWEETNKPTVVPVREKSGPLASILLHSDPAFLAMQLTQYDAALFRRIRPVEFLNQVIKPKKKAQGIVDGAAFLTNLNAFIERFDKESYWVEAEVCTQANPKAQATMITKFADVARHCLVLRNLYSLFAVVGALNFPKVRKLKEAWDLVPKKTSKYLLQLQETLMNPSKNMKNYRDVVRKFEQESPSEPILPFIPVFLKDLLFMNEGNTDKVETMINFDKLRMIANHVLELKERNNSEHEGTPDPGFQAYLAIACV